MLNELGLSNEIVANGGLNGSYAITTAEGLKLENVQLLFNLVKLLGQLDLYGRKAALKEEMQE
jgi:molybdopterin-containing oxidoreductase family iron-sulfur binding subunit